MSTGIERGAQTRQRISRSVEFGCDDRRVERRVEDRDDSCAVLSPRESPNGKMLPEVETFLVHHQPKAQPPVPRVLDRSLLGVVGVFTHDRPAGLVVLRKGGVDGVGLLSGRESFGIERLDRDLRVLIIQHLSPADSR